MNFGGVRPGIGLSSAVLNFCDWNLDGIDHWLPLSLWVCSNYHRGVLRINVSFLSLVTKKMSKSNKGHRQWSGNKQEVNDAPTIVINSDDNMNDQNNDRFGWLNDQVSADPIGAQLPDLEEAAETFEYGVFQVTDPDGQVGFDFLYEGGFYEGEMALFSINGLGKYKPGSVAFVRETVRRALGLCEEPGQIVISDFSESLLLIDEADRFNGEYQGVKHIQLTPGDQFGLMLIPNGTVEEVLGYLEKAEEARQGETLESIPANKRPLFSMSTANPKAVSRLSQVAQDTFYLGQIVDITGEGDTFVMEDIRLDGQFDKDYNDLILQVQGALAEAKPFIFQMRGVSQCLISEDLLSSSQLYLQSDGLPGADPNLREAWKLATGKDTTIGIVDNGVQAVHPDLVTNYLEELSSDFGSSIDPVPEQHGTAVAGIAFASGNNNEGESGVTLDSHWASLSLTAEDITDQQITSAVSHENQELDIYNNSWKPGYPKFSTPLSSLALEEGTSNGRDGLGNIYVFAGGNQGLQLENVNYNSLANSRYSIAVAAIDGNGEQAWYREPGASLLVSAYSNSSQTQLGQGSPETVSEITSITGESLGGRGYWARGSQPTIEFVFDQQILGELPTHAAVAWTDDPGRTVTLEAFDALGDSFGFATYDLTNQGSSSNTDEYCFLGVVSDEDISKTKITGAGDTNCWEIDHLQYGLPTTIINIDSEASETGDGGYMVVARSGDTSQEITVNYTLGGSATVGTDYENPGYENPGSSIIIPAGEDKAVIAIKPIDDTAAEGSETLTVNLGASADYALGSDTSGTVNITDYEPSYNWTRTSLGEDINNTRYPATDGIVANFKVTVQNSIVRFARVKQH